MVEAIDQRTTNQGGADDGREEQEPFVHRRMIGDGARAESAQARTRRA